MRRHHRLRKALAAAAIVAAAAATNAATAAAAPEHVTNACGPAAPGQARCFAEVRTDVHGGTGVRGPAARAGQNAAPPPGYGPADLRSAYNLPAAGGAG